MHLEAGINFNSEMHLQAMIEQVWSYIWWLRLGNTEMHLKAGIKRK